MNKEFLEGNSLKILLSPLGQDGVSWYRFKQFSDYCNRHKLAAVEELKSTYSDEEVDFLLKSCDVFHLRFNSEKVSFIVKMLRKKFPGKVVTIDSDDDLFHLSPINNSYSAFGTEEVVTEDGKKLWENGKGGFDLWQNRHRMIDYQYCLTTADAVTTTTVRLANVLKEHNPNVAVIPNAINFDLFPRLNLKKDGKIRLIWAGGSSHYEDLFIVKDAIATLMRKYPNLIFINVGQAFEGITKDLPKDRVEFSPWLSPDAHGFRLACLGADIGLAPLREIVFNESKSCVKWYEYSALGIPTVASNYPPYSDEIIDGENGFLFKTPKEMVGKVSLLIDDPGRRKAMGEKAYQWVKNHREIGDITADWVNFFKGLVEAKRKSIIDKAGS